MPWKLIDESTTRAPRNLTRATAKPRPAGIYGIPIPPEGASVGGEVTSAFKIWRHDCGALACGAADAAEPKSCGKCGASR